MQFLLIPFQYRVVLRQFLTPIIMFVYNLSFYVYNNIVSLKKSSPKPFYETKIIQKMIPLKISLKETRLLLAELLAHISISRDEQYAMSSPWIPDQLVMKGDTYEYSLDGQFIYLDGKFHSHIKNDININSNLTLDPDYYSQPLDCGNFTTNIMSILEKNSKFGKSARTNCSDTLLSNSSYKDGLYHLSIPIELPEEIHPILLQAAQIEFLKCKNAHINTMKPRYMYLSTQYTDDIDLEKGTGQLSLHTDGLHSYKHYAKKNSVLGDRSIRDSTYLISITKSIDEDLTTYNTKISNKVSTLHTLDTLIISTKIPINKDLNKLKTHQITFEDMSDTIKRDDTEIYISKPGELTFFDGYHTPTRNICTIRKRRQVIRVMFSNICFTPRLEYRSPGKAWSIIQILLALFVFSLTFYDKFFLYAYFIIPFFWGETQPGIYKKMSALEIEINNLRLNRFQAYNFDTNKIDLIMNPYTLQSYYSDSIKYGLIQTSQHPFVVFVLLGYFPQRNLDSYIKPISDELLQILSDIIFASPTDKIIFQRYIKTLRNSVIEKVRNIIKKKLTEKPVYTNSIITLRSFSEPVDPIKYNLDNLRDVLSLLQEESIISNIELNECYPKKYL